MMNPSVDIRDQDVAIDSGKVIEDTKMLSTTGAMSSDQKETNYTTQYEKAGKVSGPFGALPKK